ncbi:MAG: adenylyltransferase/cytidyltransferase family protein [Patescibacteria group bacterium]|jgi:FAD synthetase|nr:adenylyltransferase/cytidyltransferase family protein [Patescibacteria group bacterium]
MIEKTFGKRRLMVFGTFDVFHKGHEDFFRQAKMLGDYLIVVVARDETVNQVKKQLPTNSEEKRVEVIRDSGLVEDVILGNIDDKYLIIKEHRPDIICLGYDQEFFIEHLDTRLEEFGLRKTKIIKLESFKPEIYKSSKLRKFLR